MMIRSFKKCGISVPIDGSEDDVIHIQGLGYYAIEEDDMEYTDDDSFSDEAECDYQSNLTSGLTFQYIAQIATCTFELI